MSIRRHSINLIKNNESVYKLQQNFRLFRLGSYVYIGIFCLVTIGVFSVFVQKNSDLDRLLITKAQLLNQLQSTQSNEARLILLSKKLNNYNQFSKDDARFIPYYNLLLQVLKTSSQSARLAQFRVDKKRNAQFAFAFTNEQQLSESFTFIESNEFLDKFAELRLKNFSDTSTGGSSRFELSFDAVFKEMHE